MKSSAEEIDTNVRPPTSALDAPAERHTSTHYIGVP